MSKKTYIIDNQKFFVKPVKDISFRDDARVQEILVGSDSAADISPVELCSLILTPQSDADFNKCTFLQLQEILTDYMTARQFFFLNFPKLIADSVSANLRSQMKSLISPDVNASSPQT